jgi:formylglycine-generating enzyme required for sulfatase activity
MGHSGAAWWGHVVTGAPQQFEMRVTSLARRVRIFLMSPSDVAEERDAVAGVIDELHETTARQLNMSLELLRWEDVTSDAGRPQGVTNREVFAEPVDVFVGVMWTLFGTPSGGIDAAGRPYGSGTLEEFEYARAQRERSGTEWPAILFYRCNRPIPTELARRKQFPLVDDFFEELKSDGRYPQLVTDYESVEDFATRVRGDLTKRLFDLSRSESRSVVADSRATSELQEIPGDWEVSYLERMREELQSVRLPLATSTLAGHFDLSDVFVPLELQQSAGEAASADWARLLSSRRLVVTGDAGSGKSTLLRRLTLAAVDNRLRMLRGEPVEATPATLRLPIWIGLVDAAARMGLLGGPADRPGAIDSDAWLPVLSSATSLSEAQVKAVLHRGEVLLAFDQLDEVPDPVCRKALAAGIERLIKETGPLHAPNHVLVACRTRAAQGIEWRGHFDEVRIRAMSRPKRDEYLTTWCRWIWRDGAPSALANIHGAIKASSAVAELAANPQIATMLARVAADGPLPVQRVPLYDHFINTVVRSDRLQELGDAPTIRAHLVTLALAMQMSGHDNGALEVGEARRLLEAGPQPDAVSRPGSPEVLDELALHTGLLTIDRVLPGSDIQAVVRFQHRTFQEFLAACHFARHPDVLLEHALDPAWVETLTMTAGLMALDAHAPLREFLDTLLGTPPPDTDRAALVRWAPRVAAASACLNELTPAGIADDRLEPARSAQNRILPALENIDLRTRVEIAEGLGSVWDPRLAPEQRWVDIPGGAFLRGSDAADAWDQERPMARIDLSPYRIQRWPVTVADYRRFLSEGDGYLAERWWPADGWAWLRERRIDGPDGWEHQESRGNRPVTGVSWWEASAYCAWLSEEGDVPDGWRATLPTESQWEKAARGPAGGRQPDRRFPWGHGWDPSRANCRATDVGVMPVGLFGTARSPYGVWDLAGNVAERCRDGFAPYPAARTGDPFCQRYDHGHVVRGGDWASWPLDLRVSARFGDPLHARDGRTGFRVVLERVERHR